MPDNETLREQLENSVALGSIGPEDEIDTSVNDEVLELDASDAGFETPPTLSVDCIDFNDNAFIHIGAANTQEMAIAMADEYDLQPGQMVRVTPLVYFRVNHG